jgi:hypothetical protein
MVVELPATTELAASLSAGAAGAAAVAVNVAVLAKHVATDLRLVQLQLHGPLPLTTDASPTLQRFSVGALERVAPFDEPHDALLLLVCCQAAYAGCVRPMSRSERIGRE